VGYGGDVSLDGISTALGRSEFRNLEEKVGDAAGRDVGVGAAVDMLGGILPGPRHMIRTSHVINRSI
jgi:hypothetical protein